MSENSDSFNEMDARLAARLKNLEDREAWEQLFQEHWAAIYDAARKAGLDEANSQDVVQGTFIAMAKVLGKADYDPARGSLKGLLLQLARYQIIEQSKKRRSDGADH